MRERGRERIRERWGEGEEGRERELEFSFPTVFLTSFTLVAK